MSATPLAEYLDVIRDERGRRPSEARLLDEIERLRTLLHSTCATFGHAWPKKRPRRRPRNVQCSVCGTYQVAAPQPTASPPSKGIPE